MPDHPVTSLRKSLKARFRGASDNSGSVTPTAAQGSSVAALPFTIQSSNVTSVPSSQKPAISTAVSSTLTSTYEDLGVLITVTPDLPSLIVWRMFQKINSTLQLAFATDLWLS